MSPPDPPTTRPSTESTSKTPERIGPYRILEKLGEGGMGIVYLAEQERPVRRQVALKVIRRGMDTDQVLGRFTSERETLSLMDHPNIARVYDAGVSEDGPSTTASRAPR
ncbi:MAG: protein kinase [Planctomycetota bacterium]